MVHYKLYYFSGRGVAECIRQLFAVASVEFEDIRFSHDQWPEQKKKMSFGQMPVLEVDGEQIPQSLAIARYIARKYGFAGKTAFEEAMVDALADQYKDFYAEIRDYYYPAIGIKEGDVEAAKKNILIPARDKFFAILTSFLKKSGSGYLVGSDLTFVDLIVAEHVSSITNLFPGYADEFPEILAHLKKVQSIPAIKKWIETRPVTPF